MINRVHSKWERTWSNYWWFWCKRVRNHWIWRIRRSCSEETFCSIDRERAQRCICHVWQEWRWPHNGLRTKRDSNFNGREIVRWRGSRIYWRCWYKWKWDFRARRIGSDIVQIESLINPTNLAVPGTTSQSKVEIVTRQTGCVPMVFASSLVSPQSEASRSRKNYWSLLKECFSKLEENFLSANSTHTLRDWFISNARELLNHCLPLNCETLIGCTSSWLFECLLTCFYFHLKNQLWTNKCH